MTRSKELKNELGKQKKLSVVAQSEGGQVLIKASQKDLASSVYFLTSRYKTATHAELMAWCASASATLSLLEVLKGTKRTIKAIEEDLEQALKDEDETTL